MNLPQDIRRLDVANPWNANVYHLERCTSTMDEGRRLAASGAPTGTVIAADLQEAGRGRGEKRSWHSAPGENLLFTLLLRYPCFQAIPQPLTLRCGLACALAVEDTVPQLRGRTAVKWPNDLLLATPDKSGSGTWKKAAGILTESDLSLVYIGFGVNVCQREFPPDLSATSLALAAGLSATGSLRFQLLTALLSRLHADLTGPAHTWRHPLLQRLHLRGEQIRFAPGPADTPQIVDGLLTGIGAAGELLLLPPGAKTPRAYPTGEILL